MKIKKGIEFMDNLLKPGTQQVRSFGMWVSKVEDTKEYWVFKVTFGGEPVTNFNLSVESKGDREEENRKRVLLTLDSNSSTHQLKLVKQDWERFCGPNSRAFWVIFTLQIARAENDSQSDPEETSGRQKRRT